MLRPPRVGLADLFHRRPAVPPRCAAKTFTKRFAFGHPLERHSCSVARERAAVLRLVVEDGRFAASTRSLPTGAARQRQERDLSFLAESSETMAAVTSARNRMTEALDRLVERAQGAVRADITGTDVSLLMYAPNYIAGYVPNAAPDLWQRYLALILDGLRPEGAHPLPAEPPQLT